MSTRRRRPRPKETWLCVTLVMPLMSVTRCRTSDANLLWADFLRDCTLRLKYLKFAFPAIHFGRRGGGRHQEVNKWTVNQYILKVDLPLCIRPRIIQSMRIDGWGKQKEKTRCLRGHSRATYVTSAEPPAEPRHIDDNQVEITKNFAKPRPFIPGAVSLRVLPSLTHRLPYQVSVRVRVGTQSVSQT